MPLMEFDCERCGKSFETLVRAGEAVRCPACDSEALRRRVSRFSARSSSGGGSSKPIGGRSCSGCSSGNCSSCS